MFAKCKVGVFLHTEDTDCEGGSNTVSYFLLLAEFHAWLKLKVGKDLRCKWVLLWQNNMDY